MVLVLDEWPTVCDQWQQHSTAMYSFSWSTMHGLTRRTRNFEVFFLERKENVEGTPTEFTYKTCQLANVPLKSPQ